ncbi:MAG: von Willebrand factor type A domain-containing protein, partial [Nitratireductor sp.]|nr:von Willebrand factor type A domain-containing protein [Nitratireductor sp.]
MEDRLKSLAGTVTPEPSRSAREAALAGALSAYDESFRQNNSPSTQGSGLGERLKSSANQHWRNFMTRNRLATSTALATVLIVPLAGYLTWSVTGQNAPQEISSQSRGDIAKPDAEPEAKKEKLADAPKEQEVAVIAQAPLADGIAPQADEAMPQVEAAPPASALVRGLAKSANERQTRSFSMNGALAQKPVSSMPRPFPLPAPDGDRPDAPENRDRIQAVSDNPLKIVKEEPVSTFSADVDTASYSLMRRALNEGRLPDPETVRVEEMVNYFPYSYPGPDTAETPFRATVTVTPTPWNAHTKLLHIGVKGYELAAAERPRSNLVFLIDVSGSMNEADKLPLLKSAFRLLINKLDPEDTVSIVTYAGEAGTVLEPTPVSEKRTILDAMDTLRPGGGTAGAAGIEEAYRLAEKGFVKGGVNRVMLATDGDFNVGPSDDRALETLIEKKRESGVFLSVFGFGQGNYNDQLMQALAQNGNGVAAYIDT